MNDLKPLPFDSLDLKSIPKENKSTRIRFYIVVLISIAIILIGGYLIDKSQFEKGVMQGRQEVINFINIKGQIPISINGQIVSQPIENICKDLNLKGGNNNGV